MSDDNRCANCGAAREKKRAECRYCGANYQLGEARPPITQVDSGHVVVIRGRSTMVIG